MRTTRVSNTTSNLLLSSTSVLSVLVMMPAGANQTLFGDDNNFNSTGQAYGNMQGSSNVGFKQYQDREFSGNSWGTGKGDADGEVDFAISFKGKGRSDMEQSRHMALDGNGATNMSGVTAHDRSVMGGASAQGYGKNNNSMYGSPWGYANNSIYADGNRSQMLYPPAVQAMGYQPMMNYPVAYYSQPGYGAVDHQQLRGQLEMQRVHYENMAKQIAEQQQQFMQKNDKTVDGTNSY